MSALEAITDGHEIGFVRDSDRPDLWRVACTCGYRTIRGSRDVVAALSEAHRLALTEEYDRNPMRMHWFGEPWPFAILPAPACEDPRYKVPTPQGESCLDCTEPILARDSGVRIHAMLGPGVGNLVYIHVECWLRQVLCPVDLGLATTHDHDPARRRDEGHAILDHSRRQSWHSLLM